MVGIVGKLIGGMVKVLFTIWNIMVCIVKHLKRLWVAQKSLFGMR